MTVTYRNSRAKHAFVGFLGLGGLFVASYLIWMTRSTSRTGGGPGNTDPIESKTVFATVTSSPVNEAAIATPSNREEKIFQAIEATNVQINFWGKIIDQDGHPVSDASVKYEYSIEHGNLSGVAWSDQERRAGEISSDSDGLFVIQGLRGHALTILAPRKAGYQFRSKGAMSFDFYGSTASGRFIPDRQGPIVFTMIQKERVEPLVRMEGSLHVPSDGTSERWNLWAGEPDPNGDLAITFRRDPVVLERPGQAATWSADIEIIAGGIVEALWDEDVRRAPESGYLSSVAYPQTEQKRGVPYRSFYVKTAEGKFGRIQVQLYARDEGSTARCFISTDMNPKPGSRNLEPSEDE